MAFGSFQNKIKIQTAQFKIQNSNFRFKLGWAGKFPPRDQVDHSVDLGVDLGVDLLGRPGWLGLALARIYVALCVTRADVSPLDWLFELCMA